MRLHVKIECKKNIQDRLFKVATSECAKLDEVNRRKVTTRFIKNKINHILGIKVQGILYKEDELLLQVESKFKYEALNKNKRRISSYLLGVVKNVPDIIIADNLNEGMRKFSSTEEMLTGIEF